MTVTLFHHPGAGEEEWSGDHILDALRKAGLDPVCVEMGADDWQDALAATDEMAIVAGGDGTVAAIAAHIGDRELPLAILPTGSGNNVARSLGVLAPIDTIIPRLRNARTGPLRLCRVRGPWGEERLLESIGLGALAHSVLELQDEKLDGDEKLIRGRDSLTSAVEAQEVLDVRITVDGHALPGEFLLVEVMNLPMIGPNLRLVPDTELRGENLSVALLPAAARALMVEWLASGGAGIAPLRHLHGRRVGLAGSRQPLRMGDKSRDWDGSCVGIDTDPHRIRVLRPGDDR